MVQKSSALASINLFASIICCNLFWGISTYFAKITLSELPYSGLYNTTFFAHRLISLYHKLTCYKQKCKLAPFNLAHVHPVHHGGMSRTSIAKWKVSVSVHHLVCLHVVWFC